MLSTLSFTIEKHFCGDTLVDVAVFSEAKKCGMEMTTEKARIKKSCCKDEVELIKGQEDLKLNSSDELSSFQVVFATAFVYGFCHYFQSLPKKEVPHDYYSPPNIVKDIQLLDEVYLI